MFGPLFGKELLEMSRRRRFFVVRVAIGAALLFGWWAALGGETPTIHFKNVAQLSVIGEHLFQQWAYWSLWGVVILTPALVCGLIAAEKDARTFETLLTTRLTNREILVGKAASRVLLLLILIASSVPILAVASLYGGFDVKQVAESTAFLIGNCLFIVAVGLYYSTITFKPYIALVRTYFFLAVVWFLLPASTFFTVIFDIDSHPWLFMMLEFPIAGFLFWRTNRLLRRRLQPGKPPWIFTASMRAYRGLVAGARSSVERRKTWAGLSTLWRAEEASERLWRGRLDAIVEHNPLMYRNKVANVFDPERFVAAIQLFVGFGAILAFLFISLQEQRGYSLDQSIERVGLWSLAGSTILFLVCSTILAASCFARERQYGSWEVLLLTDLSAWRHLTASIAGVLGSLRLLAVIVLALAVLVGYVWGGFLPTLFWLLSVGALWLLAVVYALFTSLFHRRIAGAIVTTFLALGLILFAQTIEYVARSVYLAPAELILPILVGLLMVTRFLARQSAMSWTAVHFCATLLIAFVSFIPMKTQWWFNHMFDRTNYGWSHVHPSSAISILFEPFDWARRSAYAPQSDVPNIVPLISFSLAAALAVLLFLTQFRDLSAAEPGGVLRRRHRAKSVGRISRPHATNAAGET